MSATQNSISDKNQTDNRFSRRKRGLEPEPDTNETPKGKRAAKIQKSHIMSAKELGDLKDFFISMKTDIENKISDSQSSIECKLSDFTTKVNDEVNGLKSAISELNSKLGTEIETLKEHVTKQNHRIDNSEDDINRLKISADLKVIGIPFKQNENLTELFHKIAAAIGYDISIGPNVPLMKRIPIRNKTTGIMFESHTISLHFISIQHKQMFYSLYLNKMPLNPESLGMQKETKITIGESLTRLNANIFKYAQQLKREKKIAQTHTTDGLVKIKFIKGPNQRAFIIRNTMQLDGLLAEHEQFKQQHQQQQQIQITDMAVDPAQTVNDSNTFNSSIELLPSEQHTAPDQQQQQQQQQKEQQASSTGE